MLFVVLICLFMGSIFFFSRLKRLRESALASGLVHGVYILAVSEITGALTLFSARLITLSWILPVGIWCLLIWPIQPARVLKDMIKRFRRRIYETRGFDRCVADMILTLAGITFIVALSGIPNNWDSLTYHMPRIVFWLQNQSLSHFPTDDYRLLCNPHFAELAQAHIWILSSNIDSVMNLIQWSAYLQLIVAVTLVAAALGAKARGQLVTGLAAGTVPSLLLQAPTTQNDLLMAALLCTALAFWLRSFPEFSGLHWTLGILAAGLALATKATSFIFLPFVAFVPAIRAIKEKRIWAVVALILVLAPSAGWISRNRSFFGNTFGYFNDSLMERRISYARNGYFSPAQSVGCTAKNLSLFLATPSQSINRSIERTVRRVHDLMGEDPDDHRLRWYDTLYHVPVAGPNEDSAPSLWHFLLAISLLVLGTIDSCRKRTVGTHMQLTLLFLAGLITTCIYVKWMPWNTRFLVVWLVLLFAVTGKIIETWPARVSKLLCICLFALALPFTAFSMKRSLVSFSLNISGTPLHFVSVFEKDDALRYSAANTDRASALAELVDKTIELHPRNIGIMRKGIDPVIHPFMAMVRKNIPDASFHYALLNNQSARLRKSIVPLDIVVTVGSPGTPPDDSAYSISFTNSYGSIWIPVCGIAGQKRKSQG